MTHTRNPYGQFALATNAKPLELYKGCGCGWKFECRGDSTSVFALIFHPPREIIENFSTALRNDYKNLKAITDQAVIIFA